MNYKSREPANKLWTPVTLILDYAELLSKGQLGSLAPEQQEAIWAIADSAGELRTLIDRLAIFLQIKETHFLPYSLSEIVAEVVQRQHPIAEKAGIDLLFESTANLPPLQGDREQVAQAVECILENALRFTSTGGRIDIQLEQDHYWAILSIQDTGSGITAQLMSRIFEPFYSPTNTGLGLGLSVAQKAVEAHQGWIETWSKPDQGSRFVIRLPLHPEPKQAETTHPKRILVVDDEQSIIWMLEEALSELPNCEVVSASNAAQALQLFEESAFDLVITDYKMPETNGLTLAKQIRSANEQTNIIMLTAYSHTNLLAAAEDISIRHVLHKPIKLAEIRRIASETLGTEEAD